MVSAAPPPAPRYAIAWALLAYVLCTLVLGYPALTGGFLVTPISDQYIGGFPVRDFAAQSLRAGEGIPLWNPYIFGGLPYVAAMHGDIFYPTFIVRALLPTDIAMTLSFMIHMVLAGLFTYVFLRACGLSFWASLIGGAAYMMSGPIASYVSPGHDGKLYVSALLPLVLVLLIRGVRDGRMWAWGGLALATGLAVLSPHPQLLQYLLLAAGSFGLYLALAEWDGTRLEQRVAVQRLAIALAAVAVGFLMGAVQYYPVIEYIPWSPRSGGAGWEHAVSYSFPIPELFNMYLPQFTGILDRYWGDNGIHFHSEYLGPAMLVLATVAISATGKAVALTRSFKLFWLGVLIVSLFWALGGNTPFYKVVYYLVPGSKFFRAPSTIIYITTFAVAVFAAIGTERVLSARWLSPRYLYAWGGAAVAIALLGVTGALTNLGVSLVGNAAYSNGMPVSERVIANAGSLALGSIRSVAFTLATLAVIWAIAKGKLGGRRAAMAVLLVLVADLWSIERKYWRFSPPASEVYGSDATIEYLKPRSDSARVLTLGAGEAARDPMLSGDGLMVHEVRQVIGYHGNELGRFRLLTCGGRPCRGSSPEGPVLSDPHIRSLLNIRYLLINMAPTERFIQQVVGADALVAGPARSAYGSMVYLYRFPGDNPPAWVASASLKAPDDAVLGTLLDPRFNAEMQRRVALVDTASTLQSVANPATLPPPSAITAQVRRPSHGRILVDLSAPAQDGNVLIVSENFYPGWRATVDGRDVAAERVDFMLIGVPLAAGARQVELVFRSTPFETGKTITLIAAAVAAALLIVGLVLDRRARSSTRPPAATAPPTSG
ncbi:MAG: YfhO family protein [Gemmatimonadaceae bacterium]